MQPAKPPKSIRKGSSRTGPSRPATRADIPRPQTPAMVTLSSRANPTAGRPAKPGTPKLPKLSLPGPSRTMFKKQHSPLSSGFVPGTPKLPKLPLPEDIRRPQTPPRVTSSSGVNPTAGRPAKPLKSILRGGGSAQPPDSYEGEGEILAAKRIASPQYNVPNVLPPGSRLGKYAFDPAPPPFRRCFLPTFKPISLTLT